MKVSVQFAWRPDQPAGQRFRVIVQVGDKHVEVGSDTFQNARVAALAAARLAAATPAAPAVPPDEEVDI